jgi:soluble lytic murein transglycosylase-like protein
MQQGLIMPPFDGKDAVPPALASSRTPVFLAAVRRLPASSIACRRFRSKARVRFGTALLLALGAHPGNAETAAISRPAGFVSADPVAAAIAEAAQRFGIPASWIRSVMRIESRGAVRAVSPKGAIGLMQLMPDTWAQLRLRYGLGEDPFDPHDNVLAGAAYLRELYDRYGAAGFLAAYNAGPARYEAYRASGHPLPAETRAYVGALQPLIAGGAAEPQPVYAAASLSWTEASLFAAHAQSSAAAVRVSSVVLQGPALADVRVVDVTGFIAQSNGLFVAVSQAKAMQ